MGRKTEKGERVSEIWGGDGIGCIAFLHSEHEEWRREGVFALRSLLQVCTFLHTSATSLEGLTSPRPDALPFGRNQSLSLSGDPVFGVSDWSIGSHLAPRLAQGDISYQLGNGFDGSTLARRILMWCIQRFDTLDTMTLAHSKGAHCS